MRLCYQYVKEEVEAKDIVILADYMAQDKPAKHYLRSFSRFENIEGKHTLHLDWDSNPFLG